MAFIGRVRNLSPTIGLSLSRPKALDIRYSELRISFVVYYYSSPEQADLKKWGSKKLDLEIRSVESGKIDRVTEILRTIPVETSEASS